MGNNVLLPVWLPELQASLWTTWSDKLSHKQSHRGYIKSIGFQRDNNELVWDLVIIDYSTIIKLISRIRLGIISANRMLQRACSSNGNLVVSFVNILCN